MNADTVTSPQHLIVVTGLPGAGKSTLAERFARATATPVFAADWLMGSLKPHGVLYDLDRTTYIELGNGLMETLIVRQLLMGQSAITDCLVDEPLLERWGALAAEHGADLRVIECVCSDTELHRSRIEGRSRGIPNWHEIDWDHVERMRAEFPPLNVDKLVVDAVDPIDANLTKVLAFTEARSTADRQ
ncbi:MAG TPA: ATP-binding protein [Glycomyces sp.]|nr:ATP-binding protein [Glycomyces sp.]